MVVSEMNERLSPKKAPPTTIPVMKARFMSVFSAMPAATGTSATMVPTEVPMESEMKQAARKMPASSRLSGSRRSGRVNGPDIFGTLGECACQDENPDHQYDVLVGCADGILQHSLIQAQAFGDAYRIDRGYHESNRDGDFIEVVYNDGGHQIQA